MIDKRLNAILSVIPQCKTLADVGTDHGLLCLLALNCGKVNKVIPTDISAKSLKKAINLLSEEGFDEVADFRCGDGFNVLSPTEADVIVVSGMGGREISGMLDCAKNFTSRLVLSPQSDVSLVRLKLVDIGYKIEKDFVVYSQGKFYDIISAQRGKDQLSEEECEFGRTNLLALTEDFALYLDSEIQKAENLASTVNSAQVREKFKLKAVKLQSLKQRLYKGE